MAADLVTDVVLDEKHVFCALQDFWLMLLQPHHLRQRPRRRGHLIGGVENLRPMFLVEFGALFRAALVRPHDGTADGLHRRIQQHRVVGGAIKGDGPDAVEGDAFCAQLGKRSAHGSIPVRRILFGPATMLIPRGVFDRRGAENRPDGIDGGHFAAARAEVNAQQHEFRSAFHHFAQLCAGSKLEIRPRLTWPHMVQR